MNDNLLMKSSIIQSVLHTYLKGISLYAKAFPFENHTRFHDTQQIDKYSHNFLYISDQSFHPQTIQNYLSQTKPFGFAQFLTSNAFNHQRLQRYLTGHQAMVGTWVIMTASINQLNSNHKDLPHPFVIEPLLETNQSSFINFNYQLDLEYGASYAKGNGPRILHVIEQHADHAGFFIAKHENKMVGQVGMYHFDTIGEIDEFYVLETQRGQGIGKALFFHAIQMLKELGVDNTILVTDPTSEAYQIYKYWGFVDVISLFQTRITF